MATIQKAVTTASTAILHVTDHVLSKSDASNESLVKQLMDAAVFLGFANAQLSQRRRELFLPTLRADYSSLCDSAIPVTDKLFGDNLQQALRDIQSTNRASQQAFVQGHRPKNWRPRARAPGIPRDTTGTPSKGRETRSKSGQSRSLQD